MDLKLKLSQCMIVKNEEADIERALSWGKELMYEQIVVDTGSTDRTVEIAKALGAKVYHFEWNDDFSAAKNFALSKATGDWIAFLDADEYVHEKDLENLVKLLNNIYEANQKGKNIQALRMRIYNLNEYNILQSGGLNERFFMNTPMIRYKNRIHECLTSLDGSIIPGIVSEEVSILHTGYQKSNIVSKSKSERNVQLLLREIEEHPQDDEWWCYLGDSYAIGEEYEKALKAYGKVIEHWKLRVDMRLFALVGMIKVYTRMKNSEKYQKKVVELYNKYRTLKVNNPDVELVVGLYFLNINKKDIALQFLEGTLELMEGLEDGNMAVHVNANLKLIYQNLAVLHKENNNLVGMVKYLVLLLRLYPYDVRALSILLESFYENKESVEGVYQFLGNLYDLTLFKNKYYIMKTAKAVKYTELSEKMWNIMTKEEQEYVLEEEKNKK